MNAAAFGRVFKEAKRSGDKWFTVLSRGNGQENARLGLAISKKQCKKAVARNRLKRVVRESFRQHKAGLKGLDIVVMNKAAARDASNEDQLETSFLAPVADEDEGRPEVGMLVRAAAVFVAVLA